MPPIVTIPATKPPIPSSQYAIALCSCGGPVECGTAAVVLKRFVPTFVMARGARRKPNIFVPNRLLLAIRSIVSSRFDGQLMSQINSEQYAASRLVGSPICDHLSAFFLACFIACSERDLHVRSDDDNSFYFHRASPILGSIQHHFSSARGHGHG
jgi:hypothetical protein